MISLAHRVPPWVSRGAALALLALLVWLAATMVALPAYERYRDTGNQIEAAREQLGRVDGILRSVHDTPIAGDFSGQSWRGQSRSIVAAKVQEFVQQHARENAVTVISISPLQQRPIDRFEAIGLRIECEGEIGAIRDLIGAMENSEPFIFINGTDLRRQQIFGAPQPGQKLPLAARLDVYAPLALEEGGA